MAEKKKKKMGLPPRLQKREIKPTYKEPTEGPDQRKGQKGKNA